MHLTYLLGVLMFFPVWLILYIHRKDLRAEMAFMGAIVTIGAIFAEAFVWTTDWWQPKTITGTVVGIEDVIFAFLVGGILASIYEELFRKKLVHIRKKKDHHLKNFVIVVLACLLIGNISFFYFHIHSYYASLASMLVPTLILYVYRKDLISLSIGSGLLVILISIPIYCVVFYFDPSAINMWLHQNISGLTVIGIPAEDLVWFFVTGAFLSPLYELWKGDRLKRL